MMLRLTPQQDRAQALQAHVEQYGNPTFCRSFDLLTLSTVMQGHRLCNVNNRFDRGSERSPFPPCSCGHFSPFMYGASGIRFQTHHYHSKHGLGMELR